MPRHVLRSPFIGSVAVVLAACLGALTSSASAAAPPPAVRDNAFGAVGQAAFTPGNANDGTALVESLANDGVAVSGVRLHAGGPLVDAYVYTLDRSGDRVGYQELDGWRGTGAVAMDAAPDGNRFAMAGVDGSGQLHVSVLRASDGAIVSEGTMTSVAPGAVNVNDIVISNAGVVTLTVGVAPWRVVRMQPAANPISLVADDTFGIYGVADGTTGPAATALEVLPGGKVLLGGGVGFPGSQPMGAPTRPRLVWLTNSGAPDGAYGNGYGVTNGEWDATADLAVNSIGRVIVLANTFTAASGTCDCSYFYTVDPTTNDGARISVSAGNFKTLTKFTLDADDLPYAVNGDVAYFNPGDFYGSCLLQCSVGETGTDIAIDGSGRLVWSGNRGGQLFVGRRIAQAIDYGAPSPQIGADPSPSVFPVPLFEAAKPPIAGDDGEGANIAAAPLRSSPLRSSPLRSSPLRSSPLRSSPLRSSPLRSSPLRSSPLTAIPLRSSPLRSSGWSSVLAGTPLAGLPLQSVTFGDVLNLPNLDSLGLTLGDIDLARSPLRGVSVASMYLFYRPIGALADWCSHIDGCTASDERTLADLELQGRDLSGLWSIPLPLTSEVLGTNTGAPAPLGDVRLNDIDLARTSLAGERLSDFADLCASTCGGTQTLAEAQASNPSLFGAGVSLGDALNLLRSLGRTASLQDILPGLVADNELPVGSFPLSELLLRGNTAAGATTVSGSFSLDCRALHSRYAQLEIGAWTETTTARITAGTARISFNNGGNWLPLDDGGDANSRSWTKSGGTPLATFCDSRGTGTQVKYDFSFEPGQVLGHSAIHTFVRTGDDSYFNQQANVDLTDDGDTSPSNPGTVDKDILYPGYVAAPGDVDTYTFSAPAPGSIVSVSLTNPGPTEREIEGGGGECSECGPSYESVDTDVDLYVQGPRTGVPLPPTRKSPPVTPVTDASRNSTVDEKIEVPEGASATGPLSAASLANLPLRAQSTRRGGADEGVSILVRDSDQGKTFSITIAGRDKDAAPTPYGLRVTVTPPAPQPDCIDARSLPTATAGTSDAVTTTTDTLILWNRQRTEGTYGSSATTALAAKLRTLATAANGAIIAVDSSTAVRSAYAAWDASPCSAGAANDVVAAINGLVATATNGRPTLRHLVLVGGDDLLPQARVPDQTGIANEREEADGLVLAGKDTPQSRALRESLVLSDDPYGDLDPYAWLGGTLSVPDLALGRLVETPQEMINQIDQFTASNGRLLPQTAKVLGYDFLSDGAAAVLTALKGIDPNATGQTDGGWDAAAANSAINRSGAGITSVNGHYDHYRGLPATGSSLFSAADASPAPGSLLFTMGCHAGLNAVDVYVPGGTRAPALEDWAQHVSRAKSLFAGNTGFGYGDPSTIAYSERLMAGFATQLATKQATAGQALMYAKQRYMATLAVPGVYDAKALQEATFYGLPMYKIGTTGTTGPSALPPTTTTSTAAALSTHFAVSPAFASHIAAGGRGQWWDADGKDPIAVPLKPIQPRTDLDVTPADGLPVHGALITTLASRDINGVDPANATPTVDDSAREPELGVSGAAFPAVLQRVDVRTGTDGRRQILNLAAGHFLGTTQRLFTRIEGDVLRSASADWQPPVIASIDGTLTGAQLQVTATTPDDDVSGGVVLYLDTRGVWRAMTLAKTGNAWVAKGAISSSSDVAAFYVQLRDGAGNVTADTNKGAGFVPTVDATTTTTRGDLETANGQLASLQLSAPTKKEGDKLRKALKSFDKALAPELWTGPVTLDPKQGQKVFDESRNAVHAILEVIGDKATLANRKADLQSIVDHIVADMRALAEAAIAAKPNGKPDKLDKARKALASGIARSDPEKAIDDFKSAWDNATKA